mmetsp:Transcript_21011/g.18635  ORF Transcript_21011/g.18635 Transcript_21011/m.18635 type:complete len:94 (+) Transcript_21011:231-512(+)
MTSYNPKKAKKQIIKTNLITKEDIESSKDLLDNKLQLRLKHNSINDVEDWNTNNLSPKWNVPKQKIIGKLQIDISKIQNKGMFELKNQGLRHI